MPARDSPESSAGPPALWYFATEKLLPTAFAGATTFLVTKHVLKAKEDVVDVEVNEESSSSLEKEKAGADFSEEAKSEISESGTEENTSGKK